MSRLPIKRISRLLARHLQEMERGRSHFQRATEKLNKAIALGVIPEQPVELPGDGSGCPPKKVMVIDQFTGKDEAYKAARISRFVVKPFRPEKPEKLKIERPAKAGAAAESPASEEAA